MNPATPHPSHPAAGNDAYRQLYEVLHLQAGDDWPALLPMLLVSVAWETDQVLTVQEKLFLRDACDQLLADRALDLPRLSPQGISLYTQDLLLEGRLDRGRRRELDAGIALLAWELGRRHNWDWREHYYDTLIDVAQQTRSFLRDYYERLWQIIEEFRNRVDRLLSLAEFSASPPERPAPDWTKLFREDRWHDFLLLPLLAALDVRKPAIRAVVAEFVSWEYPCGTEHFLSADVRTRELSRDYAGLLQHNRACVQELLERGFDVAAVWEQQRPRLEEFAGFDRPAREEFLRCAHGVLCQIRLRCKRPWYGSLLQVEGWRSCLDGEIVGDVLRQIRMECDRFRRQQGLGGAAGSTQQESPPKEAVPAAPERAAPAAPPPTPAVAAVTPAPLPPAAARTPGRLQPPPVIAPDELPTVSMEAALKAVAAVRVEELERQFDTLTSNLLFVGDMAEGECVAFVEKLPAGDLWIAGDVHADLLTLANLFHFLEARERADGRPWSLVLLGDLVDRGSRDHETLLYLLDRIRRHPRRIAVLLGNHDEDLHWDEPSGGFRATIEPAEYSENLNALLAQGIAADDSRIRLGRLAERFFKRLPRAALLPGGAMLTHGGFPHVDCHERIQKPRDLSEPTCRNHYTWDRWSNAKRRFVDPGTRGNEFGWKDFEAFANLMRDRLQKPVRLLIRGHDHIQRQDEVPRLGTRWVRWEWRAPEWTYPVLTINAMGRRLESDHVLESDAPLACAVRYAASGDVEIHPLAIDPEAVRLAYFARGEGTNA